ncbi:SDR family NAD(P)-dependent oxidoreductase [Psychrobacter sp. FME5]|uniref:SDR family NAD(P)-dependent oxidoreductase n=1 Tax=Psychrobacter sp. FME5 TaxID=2487706 RepID=UPI001787E219|nr:SDR family NAD(P)-dependent oxidoreductase [Psychrobacter sp. FME5]MBE0444529.1 SDR family NAD(P)-dependent oxidoreductase [Psychrobacter sp. FME5]MDN5802732.1 SDR family NAD(P)-dependent oxidoreductase [Psychrobacter sp.]MDN5891163.1 SDR family NAD(P)-dependent oxidoreductase [Psychrobacter sp.]
MTDSTRKLNILITGATSGIGKQLAKDYLLEGQHVYAVGRDDDALAELKSLGAETIDLDLMDREKVIEAFDEIADVDLAICGAGMCEYLDMPNFDSAAFMKVMSVNMGTLSHAIEGVLPKLIASKGRLVGIGSASAYVPFARAEAYGSSKAAIHYLMKTLQISLAPHDVSVSLVVPGFVETPMTKQNDFPMPFLQTPKQASQAIRHGIEHGHEVIEFPKKLTLPLKALGTLPDLIWQQVSEKINKNSQS